MCLYDEGIIKRQSQHLALCLHLLWCQVLQGGEAVLTPDILLTLDPDTPPSDIIYTVLSGPTNGRLLHGNHTASKVTTFTQQDLNDGVLLYRQNGTRKSGAMYFKVTDGHFPAEYKMLDIFVMPVHIDMSRAKPVELTQSESSVYISRRFLNVTTNGKREDLHYEVIVAPQFGQILVRGQEAKQFSQVDVDSDAVLYVMNSLSHSEDSFRCDLHMENLDVSVKDQTVRIIVKPLVTQRPLVVPAGATVAITKTNLDASELAARTGDDPTFEITSPTNHGQILRKLRRRRDLTAQPVLKPVETFTLEDISYAKIFYMSNATDKSGPPIADSFSYVLRANNAQPANGKFLINPDEAEDRSEDAGDGGERSEDAEASRSDLDDDSEDSNTMLIVGVVLGVLLVLAVVAVVVVVLWRRHKSEEERFQETLKARSRPRPYISGPLQLEQPHVHIEPQQCLPSPASGGEGEGEEEERCLMRHSSNLSTLPIINASHDAHDTTHHPHTTPRSPDLSRTEVSPAVPDCKVTPLIEVKGDETSGSRLEAGVTGDRRSGRSSASTDLYDWTLMDPELLQHCRTETPVLKGNQYWV